MSINNSTFLSSYLFVKSVLLISVRTFFSLVNESRPGGIPARNAKGERLLLFLGIIDILQSYRLKKKLEHTLKAMIHDGVRLFQAYVLNR